MSEIVTRLIQNILIVIGIIALWEHREYIVPVLNTVIDTVYNLF